MGPDDLDRCRAAGIGLPREQDQPGAADGVAGGILFLGPQIKT